MFRKAKQNDYKKPKATGNSFVMLPKSVVDEIGYRTTRGARLDLMALSCLVYYNSLNTSHLIEYNTGLVIEKDGFVVSMLTVAEEIYKRLTGHDLEDPSTSNPANAFYRRVVGAIKNIDRFVGRITKIGTNGVLGSEWEMMEWANGVDFPTCPTMGGISVFGSEGGSIDGFVDITAPIKRIFAAYDLSKFKRAEIVRNLTDRGLMGDREEFLDYVAKNGVNGTAFTSVGMFEGDSMEAEVIIPEVVLDVDSDDLQEAFETTHQIIQTLEAEEVETENITIAFSGKKGFHIRIPSGMFGNPIFKDRDVARRVLGRWAGDFLENDIDRSVLNPVQLIRAIGSMHTTGMYCTGFSVSEFKTHTLQGIIDISKKFRPFTRKKMIEVKPCTVLVQSLLEASEMFVMIPSFDELGEIAREYENSGGMVIKRIMEGISEGEMWHDKHVGRNKAAFILACYLQKNGEGSGGLLEWNKLNSPALPIRELESAWRSASRRLARV